MTDETENVAQGEVAKPQPPEPTPIAKQEVEVDAGGDILVPVDADIPVDVNV